MEIITGKKERGRKTLLYGVHGVGKTTFATNFPAPIVIDIEDGCGDIDVPRTEVIKSYDQLVDALRWIASEDHEFKTCVIDSADHAEELICRKVCKDWDGERETRIESVADIPWGKGKKRVVEKVVELTHMLSVIRDRGLDVVVIAHDQIERVEDPDTAAYDRHVPKMAYADTSALLCEWADEVLYAHHKVRVKSEQGKFGQTVNKALSSTERLIRTEYKPSVMAKNRLGMPETISLDFGAYAEFRKQEQTVTA